MKIGFYRLSLVGIIFCILCSIGSLFAQEKTTSEMLQAKIWIMEIPNKEEGRYVKEKFTTDENTIISGIMGQQLEMTNPYYLSDELNWTFDEQKVGQIKNGKYIIANEKRRNPKTGYYREVMVFEILKLTATDLQMKNLRNNSILIYKSKEAE